MKYWINTVSLDHVQRGVHSHFMQANHGKPHMLKRLHKDDIVVFYSPKTAYVGGEPLQSFTAVGSVADDELYQFEMTPEFAPWRRNITFYDCKQVSIRPLIDELEFIEDKTHWGYKFRFGMFEIGKHDFELIKNTMRVRII